MPATPRTQLPPRILPVLYFGVAHAALMLACLAVALDPRGVSGFFYHSRMLAIVHLVTLGWISASILGSLYIVTKTRFGKIVRAAAHNASMVSALGIRVNVYFALLFGLALYALAVMWASQWIERLPNWAEALAYLVLGLIWLLPLRRFLIWMETGRWG